MKNASRHWRNGDKLVQSSGGKCVCVGGGRGVKFGRVENGQQKMIIIQPIHI